MMSVPILPMTLYDSVKILNVESAGKPISDGFGHFSIMTGGNVLQIVEISDDEQTGPVEISVISADIDFNEINLKQV